MPNLSIHPNGDGCWPDMAQAIRSGQVIHVQDLEVAGLAAGMTSGKPSVAIRIDLPDGRIVFAETSLRLFLTAADALRSVHGDPR
jgi:hypothetical protein